jgi:GGDEF domain-containing protein
MGVEMNAVSSAGLSQAAQRARDVELSSGLRAAVLNEDDARLHRLLAELLRADGLTRGRRIAHQMRVFLDLLHSLRAVALHDHVTGLYNRHGFIQTGTRLLNRAVADETPAQLIYFQLDPTSFLESRGGSRAEEEQAQQMSEFMRELCPGHAAYDALARLGVGAFAALTTSADPELASRQAILLRARRPQGEAVTSALSLRVGVARFNPSRPVTIVELLEQARRDSDEPDLEGAQRDASPPQASAPTRVAPPSASTPFAGSGGRGSLRLVPGASSGQPG